MKSYMTDKYNIDGIFLLDKPLGITSNAALQTLKRLFKARKAGHTGSLDPLATGLLPICFGEATKFSQYLLDADKTYVVTGQLGVTTDTGDAEGKIIHKQSQVTVTESQLAAIVEEFQGQVEQCPPMYSALKHQGKPLYKWAREGVSIDRPSRTITVYANELLGFDSPFFQLRVECSKGTYIRTLIEDIGQRLGCGAHVTALRRIGCGPYTEDQMIGMDALKPLQDQHQLLLDTLLPVDTAVMHWPKVSLDESMTFYVKNGQAVRISTDVDSGLIRLFDSSQQFLGIGEVLTDGKVSPRRLVRQQRK